MQTEYASSVWAVIDRFSGIKPTKNLAAPISTELECCELVTLAGRVHSKFVRLYFQTHGLPTTITFTTAHPHLTLSDPRYLRVHATCAKVTHLSGAGECIDRIIRNIEDTLVLAADGSSAEDINYVLMQRSFSLCIITQIKC
ncbi:hypothetical protein K503DRAFT_741828 [Rhizopogon vinicolor AM-OR11-026]|uniref:Uncharacterized protein n=1 Tax=Rhizopogon vinicolor AM-OR11-026 TaxID=1314800 RepID=A0A1B7MZJ6_9AGAM|nr:hypothetical protein K503DRAFT_741828 [Rhizopogon vinicolor AM-OR11-026]